MSKPSIGFIGVGMMGSGIAGCMISAGHPVQFIAHKNRGTVPPLVERGAIESADTHELLAACDVLFTCLPNADIIEAVAKDFLPHLRDGQIWIDTSTSRPEVSEGLWEQLTERGAIFADSPVTGGPEQAGQGLLASMVGCSEEHYPTIERLVSPYSKSVRRFGGPGRGHAAKLLNNLVTQGTTILLADAFECANKLGVDDHALYDLMMEGAARSGTLEKAVGPALEGNFNGAQFTIVNAAKDLRYARDLVANTAPRRAPLASYLAQRLHDLVVTGRGGDFVSTQLDPDKT